MPKINFTKVNVQVSFNGNTSTFNVAHVVGNAMRYTGSVVGDIGFDKLAENIYFSDKEIEIPVQYVKPMIQVITDMPIMATVKRYLIEHLSNG